MAGIKYRVSAAALAALIACGCGSTGERVDLTESGAIKASAVSSPQLQLDAPSMTNEDGVLVVEGKSRPAPTTQPATMPAARNDDQVLLGVSIISPSGVVVDRLVVGPRNGQYSFRYAPAEPLVPGTLFLVAQLDRNYCMITGASGPPGAATPGMVPYNAPGGEVDLQSNRAQWSVSQYNAYDQLAGRGGLGSTSPGFGPVARIVRPPAQRAPYGR